MKLVRVEEIPEPDRTKPKNNLYGMLNEFLESDMTYAEIVLDHGDYCSIDSAKQTLFTTIKRHNLPIKLKSSHGILYLAKKEV